MRRSPIHLFWRLWTQWLEKRRKAELARIREQLHQAQWQSSLAKNAHEADLSAGYSLGHFNSMQ